MFVAVDGVHALACSRHAAAGLVAQITTTASFERGVGASLLGVALASRARVVVVAIDLCSDTHTFFTVIANGARIAVQTFTLGKEFVRTSIRPGACINGAIIAVIAGPVVGHAVAIVIDAVAILGKASWVVDADKCAIFAGGGAVGAKVGVFAITGFALLGKSFILLITDRILLLTVVRCSVRFSVLFLEAFPS